MCDNLRNFIKLDLERCEPRFTDLHLMEMLKGILMMDFKNKVILAPMVRVSTHPFRLLALKYGADLVYVEEIIDCKLYESTRFVNDYIGLDGNIVFRTSEEERGRVILQLKLLISKLISESDVSGIDVNMGCPKDYSIKGGMGSALLKEPSKIKDILSTLVSGLGIPVTCKIRVLPKLEETLELVKMIEETGVSAIIVHGRTKNCRNSNPCKIDYIKEIKKICKVPIISNGGSKEYIKMHDDIAYFRELTNADSVMVARATMWNPCIFMDFKKFQKFQSSHQPVSHDIACARDYLRLSIKFGHHENGVKYCLLRMLLNYSDTEFYEKLTQSQDMKEICQHMEVEYDSESETNEPLNKKPKVDFEKSQLKDLIPEGGGVENIYYEENAVLKNVYESIQEYPKQVLYFHTLREKTTKPIYRSKYLEGKKLYFGSCEYLCNVYVSLTGYRQKRFAEQSAALACIMGLNIDLNNSHE